MACDCRQSTSSASKGRSRSDLVSPRVRWAVPGATRLRWRLGIAGYSLDQFPRACRPVGGHALFVFPTAPGLEVIWHNFVLWEGGADGWHSANDISAAIVVDHRKHSRVLLGILTSL